MTLGELIAALEAADPNQTVHHGFTNPHSYRGDYLDLAFEPASDVTVADMLADARSALGATFQGYKGGDFAMSEYTDCWLAQYGDLGETIGPLLLKLILAAPAVASSAPAGREGDIAARIAAKRNEPSMRDLVAAWAPSVNLEAEAHRLDLSEALGLGTGAPWDAIRDRAAALHRTTDETPHPEAHPTRNRWYIEILDGDGWDLTSRFHAERAAAVRDVERRNEAAPQWSDGKPVRRRLVRETTTHTVEATYAEEA